MGKRSRERFIHNTDGTVRANLTRRQLASIILLAWLVSAYIWLLRWTCRVEIVHGGQQLDKAVDQQVFIPCGWHQRLFVSGLFLLTLKPRGVRPGFLISPSREGEFIARVARAHGTAVMRGSSTRTGREALVAMQNGLANGISPMIFADGPKGPPGDFKPGTVVLARRSGMSILPIGCAIDRCWVLKTWDQTRIPKPFAHLKIALGAPRTLEHGEDRASGNAIALALATELDELTAIADQSLTGSA